MSRYTFDDDRNDLLGLDDGNDPDPDLFTEWRRQAARDLTGHHGSGLPEDRHHPTGRH